MKNSAATGTMKTATTKKDKREQVPCGCAFHQTQGPMQAASRQTWFRLHYADKSGKGIGCALVLADDPGGAWGVRSAVNKAWETGCNPGGQVVVYGIAHEQAMGVPNAKRFKLVACEEMHRLLTTSARRDSARVAGRPARPPSL
jgi:hypothetical protein